jgi:hypothetical protein
MAELAQSQIAKREAKAEQNRRDFPLMASYLKLLERFNPRAIWAEENGKRIGRVPE